MRFKMVEIPTDAVPMDVRLRAEGAAYLAAQMLEMPRLTVKYFATMPCPEGEDETSRERKDDVFAELASALGVESDDEPLEVWQDSVPQLGLTRRREPGVIHVMAFAEPFDLVKTVCHEVRHVAQFACFDGLWEHVPPSGWEFDADNFAEEHFMQVAARLEAAYQRAMPKLAQARLAAKRRGQGPRWEGY